MPDLKRFKAIWARTVGGDYAPVWAALNAGYCDSARGYHNWAHIDALLAGLDRTKAEAEFQSICSDEIELAIWFHDVVYDPLAKDNELKSAERFQEHAGRAPKMDAAMLQRIFELILATKTHSPSDDMDTQLLLDLDLSILGSAPLDYTRYVAQVRAEYAAVSDDQWKAGRPAVLSRFLQRPAIYQTEHFHRRLEKAARENVAAEIAALS